MKRIALVLVSTMFSFAACGGSPPPVAGPAADNGQPKMQAAMQALQAAQTELQAAEPNKGGFREEALKDVAAAIDQVNQGMQYAAAHPTEVGEGEGAAEEEPVDEVVKDAGNQPHMGQAMVDLREARKQLWHAKRDKGGFRKGALENIKLAMEAVHKGIEFSDHH